MTERRVLVTGATGAVGPAVVHALLADGALVRVLALPGTPAPLPAGAAVVYGDICDYSALCRAATGVDAVVHMAALLHETGERSPASDYSRVNVEGTAKTIAAAHAAGAHRIVLLSTIAVYGEVPGVVADETTPPHPDTPYAETKLAAEVLVRRATAMDGTPAGVVLRAGAVYGPHVKGNYRRLVVALARRRFVPVGDGRNCRSIVFDADLADAIVLALRHPAAPGRLFNVTDGQFHRTSAITAAICAALGRRPPRFTIPIGLAIAACRSIETVARMIGLPPPVRASAVTKYVQDVRVSAEHIRREIGFTPRYDLQTGWKATVDGLRATGAL